MRTDLGWTPGPDRHVPQPRLVRGVPGAGPGGPARRGATGWSASPSASSTASWRATSTRPATALGAFLGADPDGPRLRAQRHDRRQRRARARSGSSRATSCSPTDHEYNAIAQRDRAPPRTATGPGSSSPRSRSRSTGADEVVEAVLAAVTPRTRLARDQPRDEPDRRWSCRSSGSSASSTRAASTRSSTARTRRAWCRSTLDALGAAYYTGNGHKWLCAPEGRRRSCGSAPTGASGVRPLGRVATAPTTTRTDRSRFRLEFDWVGHRRPDAVPGAARRDRLDGRGSSPAAGPRSWPPTARWRSRRATGSWPRSAVDRPRPTRCSGSMAAVPLPGLRTDADADAAARGAVRRGPHRGPGRAAGRSRPPARARPIRRRCVLVRVSAQRYNESGDIERLVDRARPRGSRPRRSPRGTGSGRGRAGACHEAGLRGQALPGRALENGCGTHGLPRSASYSTTMNGAPGRRCAASDRIDRDLPVAARRSAGCWPRPGRRAAAASSGPVRSATSVVSGSPGTAPRRPPRSRRSAPASRSTATICAPGPSRSARASVKAPVARPDVRPDRRRGCPATPARSSAT